VVVCAGECKRECQKESYLPVNIAPDSKRVGDGGERRDVAEAMGLTVTSRMENI
jgi:hypothetical protein